jgi:hypothetical protein
MTDMVLTTGRPVARAGDESASLRVAAMPTIKDKVESQQPAAETLLPKLTKIQIKGLRRYARSGSWYRLHVHGHTIHSLEHRGLITRSDRHVTPLGHAVLAADRARVPDIFDDLFPHKREDAR